MGIGPGAYRPPMAASEAVIRERLSRTEKRFRRKDGTAMRLFDLIGKLDAVHAKVLKDDHKDIQDLVILLALRAGVI